MSRLRFRPRRDVVCREAVELVTDYLEDALITGAAPPIRSAPRALP